jgi:outer membrane receptor protein involved in Fe transport
MRIVGYNRLLLSSASALTLLFSSQAQAQEASGTGKPGDELAEKADGDTIVVTGSRRNSTVQDSTINIQAISSDDLDTLGIHDIRGMAAFTPGMAMPDTGSRSSGQVILRGLNADSLRSDAVDFNSSLAIYLGETPLYQDLKFIDIARVETLLGPQGTLYGQGTLAGAIRYIPNRPNPGKFEVGGRVAANKLAHSKDAGYNAEGFINIPIVRDRIALRSAVGYFYDPGFIDYPYLVKNPGVSDPQPGTGFNLGTPQQISDNLFRVEDANFARVFTTRNTLGLYPADGLSIYATYAHQETKTDGQQANGAGIFGSGQYEAPWRYLEPSDRSSDLYSVEVNADLGDFAKLVSATAWSQQDIVSRLDATDVLLDLNFDYELFPAFTAHSDIERRREQFNTELRLVSAHGGPISWVVGGFYNNTRETRDYKEILPGISGFYNVNRPDNLEFISVIKTRDRETAVFGEISAQVNQAFQITVGGRYYDYSSSLDSGTATPLLAAIRFQRGGPISSRSYPFPDIQFRSAGGSAKSNGFVWKANASYKFSSDLLVYATVSKGYRIGGVNRVAPCVLPLPPGQNTCGLPNELNFAPDTVINKEIGIRATLADGKIVSNLAIYHIDWDKIQLASLTANGSLGITVNGGKAVSQGLEWILMVKPSDRLVIRGSYSYLDAHLTQDVRSLLQFRDTNGRPAYADAFTGDRLPGSPKHSVAIGATYTVPMARDNSLELNWTTQFVGNVLSRVGGRGFGEEIPAYSVSQASIAYVTGDWRLSLFATNLFDKYAVTSIGRDRSRTFINDGVASRWFSQNVLTPRKVGFSVGYRY